MAFWTGYKSLSWAKKHKEHVKPEAFEPCDLDGCHTSGSNFLEGLVLVFPLQNDGWHSTFHSSISAPECKSKTVWN